MIGESNGWLQYEFDEPLVISSYSLTSANDFPDRDPQDWQLQGSNDGVNFVTLDTQSDSDFANRFQTNSHNIANTEAYQYYRLNITDNNGASFIQLAELQLFESTNNYVDVTINGTPSSSIPPHPSHPEEFGFDNNNETKWLIGGSDGWLQYEFDEPLVISSYSLTSANDFPDRDPQDWQLQGSNDGVNFVTLDTQSDRDFANRFQTNSYNIANTEAYQYYRLNITDNNGASVIQLAELQLFGATKYTATFTADLGTETTGSIEVSTGYSYPDGTTGTSSSFDALLINQPPIISSDGKVTIDENTTEGIIIRTEDFNSDDILTYSITGGNDSDDFAIDPNTGILEFERVPNYENPQDSDGNNVYQLDVTISDGALETTQEIEVTVDDVLETIIPDLEFDLANIFGEIDSNSFAYELISAIVDTLDGVEPGVVDTVLNFDGQVIDLSSNNLQLNIGDFPFSYQIGTDPVNTNSYDISYGGAVDVIEIFKKLSNNIDLISLPENFLQDVDGFALDYTDTETIENIYLSLGEISNTDDGLDIAALFSIKDTDSLAYKLVGGIVDTIDGSEPDIIDTTLGFNGLELAIERDTANSQTDVDLELELDDNQFIYQQKSAGYNISYDGTTDVLALLRTVANEVEGINLPESFVLNVDGYELEYLETANQSKIDLNLGAVSNSEEGLDIAALFGIEDTDSLAYKLVGGIVDTIDGSEPGINDTTLGFNGLDLVIDEDLTTSEIDIDLDLAIDENHFIYQQKDNGYNISYDGTIDVLALLRTLANEIEGINLPESFALNVDGYELDYLETATQSKTDLHIGAVSNSDEGLDIAALVSITDTDSFAHKLIGGIVDTIDGSEPNVTDTTLGFNGLDLVIDEDLNTSATDIDLNLAIDTNHLTYTQKDANKYQFSYDGIIDVLALVRVLINETGIISVPDNFAFNIEGFDVDFETNNLQQIVDYKLDINKISRNTIVDLFDTFELPQFIDNFIDAIAGDVQLVFTDDSFKLKYQDSIDVSAILLTLGSELGFNPDSLNPLSIVNPSLTISKTGADTNYALSFPEVDPNELITFIVGLFDADFSQELQNQLQTIGDVGLTLSNKGIFLNYNDDIDLDISEIFSFDIGVQQIEDITDYIISNFVGDGELTFENTQFSLTKEDNKPALTFKSLLNNQELLLKYAPNNITASYDLPDLDFDQFLPIDELNFLDGIKLNGTELFLATQAETVNFAEIGEVNIVDGVNLLGQIDFTQAESEPGEFVLPAFINDYFGIESVAGHVGVSPTGGLSLAGTLNADIPLITIGDFQLTFKKVNLGVDADFIKSFYAFKMGGVIELAGYDPSQSNEPALKLGGGLSIDVAGPTLTGSFFLDAEETWVEPFGIPNAEIDELAIQLGASFPGGVIAPDNLGFIADLRWGEGDNAIDIDFGFLVDVTNPAKIAATYTLNEPVDLSKLIAGPPLFLIASTTSNLVNNLEIPVMSDAVDFIDSIIDADVVSMDGDGDGELDPLFEFVPFDAEVAGLPLQRGISINGKFSASTLGESLAEGTLSVQSNETYTEFDGNLTIPKIAVDLEDLNLLTLSGIPNQTDDDLNLEFAASLSEMYFRGDGYLSILGQEIAEVDFEITPDRIEVTEFDRSFGIISLDIDDFFLDRTTFDGGGKVDVTLFGQTIAGATLEIDNGTDYTINLEQLGFGDIAAFQDVELNLDFANNKASGTGDLVFLGQTISSSSFLIEEDSLFINLLDEAITLDVKDLPFNLDTFNGGESVDVSIFGYSLTDDLFAAAENGIDLQGKLDLGILDLDAGVTISQSQFDVFAGANVEILDREVANASVSGGSSSGNITVAGGLDLGLLDFDFTATAAPNNFDIEANGGIELFGETLGNVNMTANSESLAISTNSDINTSFGSADLDLDLNVSKTKFNVGGDFDVSLPSLGRKIGSLNLGITPNLEVDSQVVKGSLAVDGFNVLGRNVSSYDLSFDTGNSLNWDDLLEEVYDSVRGKAFSIADQIAEELRAAEAEARRLARAAEEEARRLASRAKSWCCSWNGYIDGATVWFDTNNNGLLDQDEPNGITKVDGSFILEFPENFDLADGVFRSIGGTDTATGLPTQAIMSGPLGGTINPLGSLIQKLNKGGVTKLEAQGSVRDAFGISSNVDLFEFDYIDEAINGNTDTRAVLLAVNTAQGIISGIHNLLAGAAGDTVENQNASVNFILSNSAYSTLAEFIDRATFSLADLEDSTQIETIILDTVAAAEAQAQQQGVTLDIDNILIEDIADEAAQLLAAGVTKKRILSEESADGMELFTKITQAKFVSLGEEATALNDFALGNVSTSEILALADTSETALQAIRDVKLKPQLAGIFDINLIGNQKLIDLPITLGCN